MFTYLVCLNPNLMLFQNLYASVPVFSPWRIGKTEEFYIVDDQS